MKPLTFDTHLGRLTMEQYLGLAEGMSPKVAGRMLTLAADYANDIVGLHGDCLDPRHDRATLAHLGRAATRAETRLAQLLVLAAQHCGEPTLADIPRAIRSTMKTAGHLRSAICLMAIDAEQRGRDDRIAA
ncbi:MAG: hypothetical protein Q8O56_15890 [Solirubrobacteraceae bacterium]|nr:hypothetical protein [Solirubrobacteraceae bacterium]